jgi:hypothetical protein
LRFSFQTGRGPFVQPVVAGGPLDRGTHYRRSPFFFEGSLTWEDRQPANATATKNRAYIVAVEATIP